VPAFVTARGVPITVGDRELLVDVAYGGAFYAFARDADLGLDVCHSRVRDLVDAADAVSAAVRACVTLKHPDSTDLEFLYGTIITDGRTGQDVCSVGYLRSGPIEKYIMFL
jgi:proline racemase